MSEEKPLEAEVVPPEQAVAVREDRSVVNPLDLEPETFRSGLDRRKENRKALIDWVREALVEGTDFGRIPTKRGPSKPSLWKPGAEKICGMLGVTPTFPTLKQYEEAALAGKEIKSIVLRCEIVNSSGDVIAHGVGCRSLEQDYGDMNKCLKMAEKSAHIDATLRMAGLSEIFTQDFPPEDSVKTPQDAPGASGPPSGSPPAPKAEPARQSAKIQPGPEKCREKFVANLNEAGMGGRAKEFLVELGWMLPTETLATLEPRYVPLTKHEYLSFLTKLTVFAAARKAEKPYEPRFDSKDVPRGTPTKDKPIEVPRDDNPDPNSPDAPWRSFPIPFGKDAGVKLADLDKRLLYGWWANFEVKDGFEDKNGNYKRKTAEQLGKDRKLREMLDEAGKHYEFQKTEEAS